MHSETRGLDNIQYQYKSYFKNKDFDEGLKKKTNTEAKHSWDRLQWHM